MTDTDLEKGLRALQVGFDGFYRRLAKLEAAQSPERNAGLRDRFSKLNQLFESFSNRLQRLEDALAGKSCGLRSPDPEVGTNANTYYFGVHTVLENSFSLAQTVMLADNGNVQQKLVQELTMRSVLPHCFARAPADYYSRDLEYRRQVNDPHLL